MRNKSTLLSLVAGILIGLVIVVPATFLYVTPLIVRAEVGEQTNQPSTQTTPSTASTQNQTTSENENSEASTTPTPTTSTTSSTTTVSANLTNAVVTDVGSGNLMVSSSGSTYTINTSSSTKYMRLLGTESNFNEISMNDVLDISGSWTSSSHTTLNATSVTNTSIQSTTFEGIINTVNIGNNRLTIKSLEGDITLNISPTQTVITDKNGKVAVLSNLNVGDTISVGGVWDRTNNVVSPIYNIVDMNISI